MIFQVSWTSKADPKGTIETVGFLKAENKNKAKTIIESRLARKWMVMDIHPVSANMVKPDYLTINF